MKIKSYYINKDGVKGLVKSAGIWGTSGNKSFPLIYFKRPKFISEEKFKEIIDHITLTIRNDFEV